MFNGTMSHDDLFHLMLHADIDTVTNICATQHIEYCDSSMFWKLKFGHDELPILTKTLPTQFSDWRKEYNKAANKAYELMNLMKNKYGEAVFNYNQHDFNLMHILSMPLKQALYQYNPKYKTFDYLTLSYNNKYLNQDFNIAFYKNNHYHTLNISIDDLYDFLIVIFYHYPEMAYKFQ